MYCICSDWSKSIPQLEAAVDSARIHGVALNGGTYADWKHCPWCGKRLLSKVEVEKPHIRYGIGSKLLDDEDFGMHHGPFRKVSDCLSEMGNEGDFILELPECKKLYEWNEEVQDWKSLVRRKKQ